MGNIPLFSSSVKIELYKWSSAEFPEEYAVIYTSLNNASNISIFRLSANPEKVLCRLADSLCEHHPVRIHMEIIAERENGYFQYQMVKVVADGTSEKQIPFVNELDFTYSCEKRNCLFGVTRNGEEFRFANQMNWEVAHHYNLSLNTHLKYSLNIECANVTGLSVKFNGPMKYRGVIFEHQMDSQIHRMMKGEPPKAISSIVEREFVGKQYILFHNGKGNTSNARFVQGLRVTNNSSAKLNDHGNGGAYNNGKVRVHRKGKQYDSDSD